MKQAQGIWKEPASGRFRKNQSGIALITVIAVFAILVIVIGATIIIATTENSTSQNSVRAEQALSLAEAGIDWAAATITDTTSSISTTLTISGAPVHVTVSRDGTNTITVVSSSLISAAGTEYPEARRAIQVTFTTTQSFAAGGSLFERAITTNGKITTKNNATIHVSSALPSADGIAMLSNYTGSDAVVVGNGFSIDGKVGLMNGATAPSLESGQKQTVPTDPVPTLTPSQIDVWRGAAIAQNPGHYFSSDQNWGSGITLNGIYFVDGNLEIQNKLAGNGTLVVNGDLTAKNGLDWTSTSMALLVIGNASLDIKNNASITGYIYVNGDVEFKNNMTLVGAITATGDVYFGKNNATIIFQNLGEGGYYNPPGFTTKNQLYSVSSWQEVAPLSP